MIGAWWQERPQRERVALVAGGLAVLATAGYLMLEPVIKERQRLAAEIPQLRQDLAWMQEKLDTVKRLQRQSAPEGATSRTLTPAMVQAAVRRAGLQEQVAGLRTAGGEGVRVTFDRAPFAAVTEMLQDLRRRSGAQVTQARIDRLPESEGQVKAELSLVAGAKQ